MHIISIIVHDKIAVNLEKDRYVCGNSDFIIHFDFDAEWDEFDVKTARFVSESGEFIDKLFTGSDCEFPVFENTNKVLVGVFAGNLRTTTAAYVPALKSIRSAGGAAAAPSDDVYDQIMARLNAPPFGFNLVNGKAEGSVRAITAAEETDEYRLGKHSSAIGQQVKASGYSSFAEGYATSACGNASHAEGSGTTADGINSHAEGTDTVASGASSHAEGRGAKSNGAYAHAEGSGTTASGNSSHAEGGNTVASGPCSHAEGDGTIASGRAAHAQGQFNVEDPDGNYLHIVGNGNGEDHRRNAHTLDRKGNAWFAGDVYVGGTDQDSGEKLIKSSDVDGLLLKPAETASVAYLRWNGSEWAAATIADLKADLGLA